MANEIVRKKNTGEPGNGGQFGTKTHTEADVSITAAAAIAEDLKDVLCWSCQDDATRLTEDGEGRCDTCPDDYSGAIDRTHPSDMSYTVDED